MNDTMHNAPGRCRFCGTPLSRTFIDLGMSPLCQTHIEPDRLNAMERFYPLHAYVCETCYLVQLEEFASPDEIFSEYAYYSSFAESWLRHVEHYAGAMVARLGLGPASLVTEVASNDGYLLQYFRKRGIPVLGVEPAANVARAAEERGIRTVVEFLGEETAREIAAEHGRADLLVGNNVLAHVPDLNDFVRGLGILLKPGGVLTMEFPHLLSLIELNQFDTIYHEHFSYFSLTTAASVFRAHGLVLHDVEKLPTHGGSLRIYVRHATDAATTPSPALTSLLEEEEAWGVRDVRTYARYAGKVMETKRAILKFLLDAKAEGKQIVGYGAPGKGNTLLNYCGIRTDFLSYTVDRNPYKQGKYTPGTHIPIFPPERIRETKPDYLFILPWNLKEEILEQNAFIRNWGGKFVVPIPAVQVIA